MLCYAALYCEKRFDWGNVQCLIAVNFSTDNNIFFISVSVENNSHCCYIIMYGTMIMRGVMINHCIADHDNGSFDYLGILFTYL
jgi:hypothetical protein